VRFSNSQNCVAAATSRVCCDCCERFGCMPSAGVSIFHAQSIWRVNNSRASHPRCWNELIRTSFTPHTSTPHTSLPRHLSHLTPHTSTSLHTSHLTPHTSHLTPHTSPTLTPHTSHLTPHTSHLTPHTSHLTPSHLTPHTSHPHTPHTSHLTPHTSHLTPHTSHLTPHTSHLTPHTSHLPTPHTSHLTPHTSHLTSHTTHLTPYTSHLRNRLAGPPAGARAGATAAGVGSGHSIWTAWRPSAPPPAKKRWRFCIDYRKINRILIQEQYPLPETRGVHRVLGGREIFGSADVVGDVLADRIGRIKPLPHRISDGRWRLRDEACAVRAEVGRRARSARVQSLPALRPQVVSHLD